MMKSIRVASGVASGPESVWGKVGTCYSICNTTPAFRLALLHAVSLLPHSQMGSYSVAQDILEFVIILRQPLEH